MRMQSAAGMPWNLSIAPPPSSKKIVYKTDDDASVHRAFETLVQAAFHNQKPSTSRLRKGISTLAYAPSSAANAETIPEITLKHLLRLQSQAAVANLDVQIGLRGQELLVSARKRVDVDKNGKKRSRDDGCTGEPANKRSKSSDASLTLETVPEVVLKELPIDEKARQIAQKLTMLREPNESKVVDTVLINVNKEEASQAPTFAAQTPTIIMVVKLISGAALSLNELQLICNDYGLDDGLFTSRTVRQSNLSDIGTPTWRAAKAEGLLGATLLLNVK
jgi:hypothetical protein